MQWTEDVLAEVANGRMLKPSQEICLGDLPCLDVYKRPKELTLDEAVDDLSGLSVLRVWSSLNQFGHEPLAYVDDNGRIHLVGVDIAAGMADPTVVSDVVKPDHHPRYENAGPPAVGNRLVLVLQGQSGLWEARRLLGPGKTVPTVQVPLDDREDGLAQVAAVEFGRLPAVLAIVLEDLVEGTQEVLAKTDGETGKRGSCW